MRVPKDNAPDSNIYLTCVQSLIDTDKKLKETQKQFLELTDFSFEFGGDPEGIIKIAEKIGFFVCCWCKERGEYPSKYLKSIDKFSLNRKDKDLNGRICDKCIGDFLKDEEIKMITEKA